MPTSFKVAVTTKYNRLSPAYNGLRFATRTEAHKYGTDLQRRWNDVVSFNTEGCAEAVNAQYPVPNDRYYVGTRRREQAEEESAQAL